MKSKLIDRDIVSDLEEIVGFLENILQASTQYSIIGLGADGTIQLWNEGARRLYGFEPHEVVGLKHIALLHTRQDIAAGKPEEMMARALREGKWTGCLARVRRDGTEFIASVALTVRRNASGEHSGFLLMSSDVSEQIRVGDPLRMTELYNRSLIEVNLDPLMIVDTSGAVRDVSKRMQALAGRDREAIIGSRFESLFSEPGLATRAIEAALSGGGLSDCELTILSASRGAVVVLVNASILQETGRPPHGVILVMRDITEWKRDITNLMRAENEVHELNRGLEERNAELAASNGELEAFTYSIAHDLRAPLRHIQGFSKMLAEDLGELPPSAQESLKEIIDSTEQMGQMVDDMLSLARIGRQELSTQLTSLKTLVEEVLRTLKPDTLNREIRWQIGELPYVDCDPGLMKQVFLNLLSNAIKYTRRRKVAVIEVGQALMENRPVLFVKDNGVGFNMKFADKLFGVFQRLHRKEDFEGTGVGLATVQRIIQKHGGKIWAEAELDKGATFYFELAPLPE